MSARFSFLSLVTDLYSLLHDTVGYLSKCEVPSSRFSIIGIRFYLAMKTG
jgi:hypothetical protein